MTEKRKKVILCATIPPETWNRLNEVSKENDLNPTQAVRWLLKRALDEYDREKAK